MAKWHESDNPDRFLLGFIPRYIIIVAIAIFAVGGLSWGAYRVFGPANRETERKIFEESQWHKDAVVNEFTNNCGELARTTDPESRKAIVVIIAQRAGNEDLNSLRMAPQVRQCVDSALNEYVNGTR